MTENNLHQEEAMAMLPRPGLLTQDNPTLMGILTLGNKQSVELVASDYFAHHEVWVGLEFESSKVCTVQSRFSDIKFSDNLWFSDYFVITIFQFTT